MQKITIAFFIFVLSVGLAGCSSGYEGESAEFWFNAYDEENAKVEEFRSALEEANDNIDQANSNIRNAKYYSGESYEDMEDALDSLNTVDNVDEPY